MSFGVLRHKVAPQTMQEHILQHPEMYGKLGEFYEDLTNEQGGKDFLCKDLEAFLAAKNPQGKEYGKFPDYSSELVALEGFSIPLYHTSKNAYIQRHYERYAFYVKKK